MGVINLAKKTKKAKKKEDKSLAGDVTLMENDRIEKKIADLEVEIDNLKERIKEKKDELKEQVSQYKAIDESQSRLDDHK